MAEDVIYRQRGTYTKAVCFDRSGRLCVSGEEILKD
jgi:hypothetical protein